MLVLKLWFFHVEGLKKRQKKLWLKLAKINTNRGVKDKVKTNW